MNNAKLSGMRVIPPASPLLVSRELIPWSRGGFLNWRMTFSFCTTVLFQFLPVSAGPFARHLIEDSLSSSTCLMGPFSVLPILFTGCFAHRELFSPLKFPESSYTLSSSLVERIAFPPLVMGGPEPWSSFLHFVRVLSTSLQKKAFFYPEILGPPYYLLSEALSDRSILPPKEEMAFPRLLALHASIPAASFLARLMLVFSSFLTSPSLKNDLLLPLQFLVFPFMSLPYC